MAIMKTNTWSWWEVLLWAYSVLYISVFLLIFLSFTFFPSHHANSNASMVANIVAVILTVPVLAFMIGEGIKHLPRNKD